MLGRAVLSVAVASILAARCWGQTKVVAPGSAYSPPVAGAASLALPTPAIASPATVAALAPVSPVLLPVGVAATAAVAAAARSKAQELASAAGRLRGRIESNKFEVRRGLDEYLTLLGIDFTRRLASLKGHWLDAGAGQASAAIQFLFEEELRTELSHSIHEDGAYGRMVGMRRERTVEEEEMRAVLREREMAAISADVLADKLRRWPARYPSFARKPFVTAVSLVFEKLYMPKRPTGGRFRVLSGRYFLDIPAQTLTRQAGQAELITDVFGVFAYDPRPDRVLARYLELLADDGAIYILSGLDRDPHRLSLHRVRTQDGKTIGLLDWLDTIPGLEVTTNRNGFFDLPASTSVRIRKTGERVRIPSLALVEVDDSKNPPFRVFQER